MIETISASRLRDWIDERRSFALVDTRPDESYDAWHIQGAIQYTYKPDFEFDAAAFRAETGLEPDDEIVTICAKGVSSFDIAKRLADSGYGDVTVVEEGMEGWSEVYDVGDVPTGAALLYESLHGTLLAEPDDVSVLPGHFAVESDGSTDVTPGEPVVTTTEAVSTGLDLLAVEESTFVGRLTAALPEKPPNYGTIIDINAGLADPGDEQTRTELELGPNNCAATAG